MATITSGGRVTIPKRLRDALGLKPGSHIVFQMEPNGQVIMKTAGDPKTGIVKMRGSMKGAMSTEEILRLLRQ